MNTRGMYSSVRIGLLEDVRGMLRNIIEAWETLTNLLEKLRDANGNGIGSLRSKLIAAMQDMESGDLLVP